MERQTTRSPLNQPVASILKKSDPSAAEQIAEKLSEKGLRQILPVLKPAARGIREPLKEGETGKAKKYAKELASKLKVE